MRASKMKHKASLWEGEVATSRHITDVYWEGDITQEELVEVANQISGAWRTIDLELDPAHPRHGETFRLTSPEYSRWSPLNTAHERHIESQLAGQYVWVHCCQHVFDPAGELQDPEGRHFRQVFSTLMFCTEFTTFNDVADQCDDNFGAGEWDAYELYTDDSLPSPVASFA